ncbi:MAG TPA: TIGR02186 family protein [Propylenella sp.]
MKGGLVAAIVAIAALAPAAAFAESLVAALSDEAVRITSNFTGEQIVVFGAIRGTPDEDAEYEVAVVVEGPQEDVIVRRKERLLGVWANRTSREFKEVPSYYVMHLSENFSGALDPSQLSVYRLGVRSHPFVQEAAAEATAQLFAEALIALKAEHGLYVERQGAVDFLAPNVFRTTFFLPSAIPTGEYRVSVYLFRSQTFLAGRTDTLSIAKGGFSERIARSADDYPLYYGLVCVALAVFTGWFAGVIFRRPL